MTASVTSPVSHRYDSPPEAVSVTELPVQIIPSSSFRPDVSDTATDGTGNWFTVTSVTATAGQLPDEVRDTE